ncbi:MAG TPA: fumarylacetoacetate hydrolase family protein [Acetobacteraceae bacterium]
MFDPSAAAAALLELRRGRQQTRGLPASIAPRSEADGAEAQLALARLVGAVPPAGFKIGATGKRMQAYLGLSGPAGGFMAAAGLHASGATLHFADFLNPGVECEVAVRLARDLPAAACSPAQAAAAVGELMAGIEIVENRYHDLVAVGVPTMIADQVFHAAAVVGAPGADWRGLDVPALTGRMSVDGEVREQGVASDLLGHPMNCLAWLAGSAVAAAFGGLKAGQVIMLGSVTPPIWLDRPAKVAVEFAPLPPVTVTLD